jgi:ethanolamine utilization microcompartment shell protein EutS
MADNVPITPGSGAVVAADEATYSGDTAKIQLLRLVQVTGSEGSKTVVEEIGVLSAGANHVGQVGSPLDTVAVTPTVSTTPAYTSGDAVGGKQTLTSAMRVSGGKSILQTLTVIDKADQKQPLTVLFFDSDPTAATITDNAGFVFSTDISKFVGKVNVLAADYETVNSIALATISNIGLLLKASGSANLFAAVVTTGTPQFSATSDLIFQYGFAQG